MRKVLGLLLFALMLVPRAGETSAQPSYYCQLKWELIAEGRGERSFELRGAAEVSPFPRFNISVSGGSRSSKVSVAKPYGEGDKDSIRYELSCDSGGNCSGSRVSVAAGKTTVSPFTILPSTPVIATLGQREIFVFESSGKGFDYQFIEYEMPSGEPAGFRLSCHE